MSAINEAPDAATAALQYMMLAALAAASSVETVDLFIIEEAMTAIPKAGQVRTGATSRQPPSVLGMHRVSEDPSTFRRLWGQQREFCSRWPTKVQARGRL